MAVTLSINKQVQYQLVNNTEVALKAVINSVYKKGPIKNINVTILSVFQEYDCTSTD